MEKFEEGVCYGRLGRGEIREVLMTAKTETLRMLFANLLEEVSKHDCEFLLTTAKKIEKKR